MDMRVRCIDNKGAKRALTVGTVYEKDEAWSNDKFYYVTNDYGICAGYRAQRFEPVVEQSIIKILHPYTVLVWTKDRGFQPCGAVFKTADAVFEYVHETESPEVAYIHTPSGCMYTPNAIKSLGLNLWKEVNKE